MGNALERILIAVDGSDHSLEAALYAGAVLRTSGAEIKLLHVFQKVPEAFWELERDPGWAPKVRQVRGWEAEQREKALRFLETVRGTLIEAGFPTERVGLELLDPADGVLAGIQAAAAEGCDAVVVGRRGRHRCR